MNTAGEDLKRYLIVPSSSSSSPPSSSPATSNSKRPIPAGAHQGTNTTYEQSGFYNKAAECKMEVDTPTQPPTSFGGAHAEEMIESTPPEGIFKMDDFLKQNKDVHEAQQLAREAKHATSGTPSKKTKTNEKATPLTPVAVGARSSRHTILLHEKYQALGISQPHFTYGGGSETGWIVSVSFPGLDDAEELQGLSEERKFNSKQEAKEAMSQKALAVLEELEREGRVKKGGKSKKKKNPEGQVVQPVKEEKGPGENYVGQLLEFQRATSSPQPTYTDYQSGQRFSCLITIEGQDQQFGSIESLFSSKKAARQDAARHAVEHFKSIGTWPDDATSVGGIKKKKKTQPTDPEIISISSPVGSSSSPSTTSPTATTSYAQQVASLAVTLALPTPEWSYTPHPSDGTFHTVCCFFRGAGPHEGPIGEVRNVYGKKKAKEDCARLTLEYLKEVKEKRMAYGMEVMRGVMGEEGVKGVVGAGVGRRVEGEERDVGGEKGNEKAAVGTEKGMGMGMDGVDEKMMDMDVGESSEDEVFADAIEG